MASFLAEFGLIEGRSPIFKSLVVYHGLRSSPPLFYHFYTCNFIYSDKKINLNLNLKLQLPSGILHGRLPTCPHSSVPLPEKNSKK